MTSEAMRTCVGCRQVMPQSAVLRLAAVSEPPYLVPDATKKLGGRGVWVEARRECIDRAARKGGFSRAMRREVRVDPNDVAVLLSGQLERRLVGLLGGGYRARKIVYGTDAVKESLRANRTRLLGVAVDAAGSRDALETQAERIGRRCVVYGDKEMLGAIFGRDEVGVYGVEDDGIASEVVRVTTHLAGLHGTEAVPYEERGARRASRDPGSDKGGDRDNA